MIKKLQRRIELILSITMSSIVIIILAFAFASQYNENSVTLDKHLRRAEDASYDAYYDSILGLRMKEAGDDTRQDNSSYAYPESPSYAVFIERNGKEDPDDSIANEASGDAGKVKVGNNNKGIAVVQNADADMDDIEALGFQMKETGNDSGDYSHYRFSIREVEDVTQITFIDTDIVRHRLIPVFALTGMIAAAGMAAVIIVSILLARYLVQPIEENMRRQRAFVADASHELKTPLAVVDVNIDMARSTKDNDKYLGYIKGETGKMNRLIQELLTLASAEDADPGKDHEVFDLSETIEGVILPFEAAAFEHGVTIEQKIERGIRLVGNPIDISRMAETLIENAIGHASSGTSVDVGLSESGRHIIFTVGNHGETISPEAQKHLFERFYRVDKARNRKEGHFGLGLAIAKAIVDRHNGSIAVESEDGYTTFTVTLHK
ncbi:sensor histidine kinase [Candidatus Weimeria sp. HCP3S3_B5]|uniref:sensor histidine kinase n=1 Tax=Candidatus Weimeria sp. HCP3S3_B5 TaxID=3438871 RepID=UPI003040DAFD|nr:ATP-binding protein [Lachnospiraceae bacterium]